MLIVRSGRSARPAISHPSPIETTAMIPRATIDFVSNAPSWAFCWRSSTIWACRWIALAVFLKAVGRSRGSGPGFGNGPCT